MKDASLPAKLELDSFVPYRLAVLADAVSRSIAQIYKERFDLSRDEWRVLVALVAQPGTRAAFIIAHASLDKLSVSRALARMETRGLVARAPDPEDGRGQVIRLLPAGRALYRKIEPLALAREAELLSALEPAEREALAGIMAKLEVRAQRMARER